MVNRWSSLVEKISTLWPSGTGVLDILTRKRLSSSILTVLICLHFCRFSLHFHIFNTFCLHFCRLLLPLESFASWIDVTLSSQQVTHRIALYFSNVWVVWLVDFVISSGDNFYHDGVESPVDEKFDTRWKDMYSHPSIAQLPWWDARVFDIR